MARSLKFAKGGSEMWAKLIVGGLAVLWGRVAVGAAWQSVSEAASVPFCMRWRVAMSLSMKESRIPEELRKKVEGIAHDTERRQRALITGARANPATASKAAEQASDNFSAMARDVEKLLSAEQMTELNQRALVAGAELHAIEIHTGWFLGPVVDVTKLTAAQKEALDGLLSGGPARFKKLREDVEDPKPDVGASDPLDLAAEDALVELHSELTPEQGLLLFRLFFGDIEGGAAGSVPSSQPAAARPGKIQ